MNKKKKLPRMKIDSERSEIKKERRKIEHWKNENVSTFDDKTAKKSKTGQPYNSRMIKSISEREFRFVFIVFRILVVHTHALFTLGTPLFFFFVRIQQQHFQVRHHNGLLPVMTTSPRGRFCSRRERAQCSYDTFEHVH